MYRGEVAGPNDTRVPKMDSPVENYKRNGQYPRS